MPNRDEAAVVAIRAAVPGVIAVYRFGSSATGVEGAESDIDLGVLAVAPMESTVRLDLQERLASVLHRPVDLIDLRSASPVIRMQVVGTGRLLFDGDAHARGRFEDLTYGVYARLNEERRGILERVRAEGTVYGR